MTIFTLMKLLFLHFLSFHVLSVLAKPASSKPAAAHSSMSRHFPILNLLQSI